MRILWLGLFSLLAVATVMVTRAARYSMGVYRFSRAVQRTGRPVCACDKEACPARILTSAMDDTHVAVRREAFVMVFDACLLGFVTLIALLNLTI